MNDSKYKPTLCVGADVHLDKIVLRAVDKALGHEVLQRFRVTNNLPGAQLAATTIAQAATELGYARIEVGWESTGMLWIPFHRYLSTVPLLHPFELELVCFNPKLVAKFKDGLVLRSPKNDERGRHIGPAGPVGCSGIEVAAKCAFRRKAWRQPLSKVLPGKAWT